MPLNGTIDALGYHAKAAGWFATGSINVGPALAGGLPLARLRLDFEGRAQTDQGRIALLEGSKPAGTSTGFVLYLGPGGHPAEAPQRAILWFGRQDCQLAVAPNAAVLSDARLVAHCRQMLGTAFQGHIAELSDILAGHEHEATPAGTIEALDELVRVGFDEIITCDKGALLVGWLLAAPGAVRTMSLCWGSQRRRVDPARQLATLRPDVLDNGGRRLGFEDPRCGFIAYVPDAAPGAQPPTLMVETRSGSTGRTNSPQRRQAGLPAIKRILDMLDLPPDGIRQAFGTALGPVLDCLNRDRLAVPARTALMAFGAAPKTPRCSLVVPLFGRIDYLEYQLALLSADPAAAGWDIIYVLDEPARRQEALDLAQSAFARFAIPFRLLLLDDNLGYAPANNLGLQIARGDFVCFLNSDVFAGTRGFLDRLADTLEADAGLGAVGAVLLFEDGSVQHEGMRLRVMSTHDGLLYPTHGRKGRRPRAAAGVERCDAITGACLTLRRTTALEIGGFDETYILGDFEDCDMCDRLRAMGKHVAVDHGVQLFHLERQSQTAPDVAWRRNMTLYNAWRYNVRRPDQPPPVQRA